MKFRPPFMVQTSPKHQENPSKYLIYRPLLQIITNRPPCRGANKTSRKVLTIFRVKSLLGTSSFGRKFRYAHRGRVTSESGSMVLLQILWNNFVDSSIADQQTAWLHQGCRAAYLALSEQRGVARGHLQQPDTDMHNCRPNK